MTIKLTAKDLVLGDKVNLLPGEPYGWATVVQITDEEVHMVRPYVHIGDFTYTGGVLNYLGNETVKVWAKSDRTFEADTYTHSKMTEAGALK